MRFIDPDGMAVEEINGGTRYTGADAQAMFGQLKVNFLHKIKTMIKRRKRMRIKSIILYLMSIKTASYLVSLVLENYPGKKEHVLVGT